MSTHTTYHQDEIQFIIRTIKDIQKMKGVAAFNCYHMTIAMIKQLIEIYPNLDHALQVFVRTYNNADIELKQSETRYKKLIDIFVSIYVFY